MRSHNGGINCADCPKLWQELPDVARGESPGLMPLVFRKRSDKAREVDVPKAGAISPEGDSTEPRVTHGVTLVPVSRDYVVPAHQVLALSEAAHTDDGHLPPPLVRSGVLVYEVAHRGAVVADDRRVAHETGDPPPSADRRSPTR